MAAATRRSIGVVAALSRKITLSFPSVEDLVLERPHDTEMRLPADLLLADAYRAGAHRGVAAQHQTLRSPVGVERQLRARHRLIEQRIDPDAMQRVHLTDPHSRGDLLDAGPEHLPLRLGNPVD